MFHKFERVILEDMREGVIIPMAMLEELMDIRDKYSALMTAQGKNLHGYDFLTPEERYGE